MIRLGLIGCGAWGYRYIPAALQTGFAKVTHASASWHRPDVPASLVRVPTTEWRSLLQAPLDAFIVATPPDTHEEICTTLLEAGRPVMVEKPFALSVEAAERIAVAAAKSGVPLLVNHQHLFAPAFETLLDVVGDGRRWTLESIAGNDGPERSYSALWDYGPHDVAMAVATAHRRGASAQVRAAIRALDADSYRLEMSLGDSARMSAYVSRHLTKKTRLLRGTSCCGRVEYNEHAEHILTVDGKPRAVDPERPLQRAIRHFAEAVKTGKTDWRFGAELPLAVTRILEQADRMTKPPS